MAEDGVDSSTGPKDAAVMEAILKEMGVEEYDPNVVHQMLEFSYRYVTNVLEDARMYSEHAQKKEIDVSDVRLAAQTRVDHSFATPPPRDFLIEVARKKNSTPLPLIPERFGPRLPPERYCLTANNYKLKEKQKAPSVQKPQVTLSATYRLPKQQLTTASSSLRTQLSSPLTSTPGGISSSQSSSSMPTLTTGKLATNSNTNNSKEAKLKTLIMNMPQIAQLD